jgi:hypothetical protein
LVNRLSVLAYMAVNDPVARFINKLKEKAGYEKWADFARDAEVLSSSLSNWQMGNIEASGPNLLKLIWAAERRREGVLHEASLGTDPEVAFALRMVQSMRRPIPVPDDEPEFDENEELARAWDEAGRPGDRAVEIQRLQEELAGKSGEVARLAQEVEDLRRAKERQSQPEAPPRDP